MAWFDSLCLIPPPPPPPPRQLSIPWSAALPCLLLTSLLQVADYYTTSIAQQRVDQHRLACVSSLAAFLLAFTMACLLWWFLPPVDHTLSAGVVIATVLFILVTPSLTHPLSRSHGILVGYSTAGLPLYQSHHIMQSSVLETAKSALIKIMENSDSRRIFYFLILNLVSALRSQWEHSLECFLLVNLNEVIGNTCFLLGQTPSIM